MGSEIGWGADSVDFLKNEEIKKGNSVSLLFYSVTQLWYFELLLVYYF